MLPQDNKATHLTSVIVGIHQWYLAFMGLVICFSKQVNYTSPMLVFFTTVVNLKMNTYVVFYINGHDEGKLYIIPKGI